MPVGRTHARNPTASPAVAHCLLMRGGLGPTGRAVLMRTTCVGGVPRICDTRVIRGVVHHATVVRGPLAPLEKNPDRAVGSLGHLGDPPTQTTAERDWVICVSKKYLNNQK